MPLAIIHRSHDLGLTCGTYYCGENMEDVVEEKDNRILKETECHSETIEVPHMKGVFKEFDSVRFKISSHLVLYA